ncbi:MAG: metallophosphoesterase family protein [Sphaerochaetaceae bacterium]|nr:metallophosphoesterase family protein [Sphaerochaetaceae bacterium]
MNNDVRQPFILVASDIHDNESALETLGNIATDSNCIAFLYCGDINIDNFFICNILRNRNFTFLPVLVNFDSPLSYSDAVINQISVYRTYTYSNVNIFLSHGHKYYEPAMVGLDNKDYNIVITGHTHIGSLNSYKIGSKEIINLNPGSPSLPRGKSQPSYGKIVFENYAQCAYSLCHIQLVNFRDNRILAKKTITI